VTKYRTLEMGEKLQLGDQIYALIDTSPDDVDSRDPEHRHYFKKMWFTLDRVHPGSEVDEGHVPVRRSI
jgi:hypothetical protein